MQVGTDLAAKDCSTTDGPHVAVSRGAEDAQIFTNNRDNLPIALNREVSQQSAHLPSKDQITGLQSAEESLKIAQGIDQGLWSKTFDESNTDITEV